MGLASINQGERKERKEETKEWMRLPPYVLMIPDIEKDKVLEKYKYYSSKPGSDHWKKKMQNIRALSFRIFGKLREVAMHLFGRSHTAPLMQSRLC